MIIGGVNLQIEWSDIVLYLFIMAMIGVALLVLGWSVLGAVLNTILQNAKARRVALVIGGLAVTALAGNFVFSVLRANPDSWIALVGVLVVGVPVGAWLMKVLDDQDDPSAEDADAQQPFVR